MSNVSVLKLIPPADPFPRNAGVRFKSSGLFTRCPWARSSPLPTHHENSISGTTYPTTLRKHPQELDNTTVSTSNLRTQTHLLYKCASYYKRLSVLLCYGRDCTITWQKNKQQHFKPGRWFILRVSVINFARCKTIELQEDACLRPQ
jgi:hypothetical protein